VSGIVKKLLVVVVALVLIQEWDRISVAFTRPEPIPGIGAGDVVMYATAWCGYCQKTREFLRDRGVPFIERDIEQSAQARREYQALNGRGVPLLVIRGTVVVQGYSPREILRALGQ
jgi:glutaredoxin